MSPPTLQFSYPYSQSSSLLNNEPLLRYAGRYVPFPYNHARSRSTGTPSTSWRQQFSNQPVNEYGTTKSTSCTRFNVSNINVYSRYSRCSSACQSDGQPARSRGADFNDTYAEPLDPKRATIEYYTARSRGADFNHTYAEPLDPKRATIEYYSQPIYWAASLKCASINAYDTDCSKYSDRFCGRPIE